MKISKYLGYFMRDFFVACGVLMIATTIFLTLYSTKTINSSLLIEIMLVAAGYTFFKFSLFNNYELERKAQMISFFVCFILADLMIIILLCFFSPSQSNDMFHIISYIATFIIVKGLVYTMMYIDSRTNAKQLNEKLTEYKNEAKE
jgi:uncharacterized membrane protein HdeD (DUF308 family)